MILERLGHVLGRAAKRVAVAGRPADAVKHLQDVGRDVARTAPECVGVDVDLAVEVAPVDLVGTRRGADVGHLRESDHAGRSVGRGRHVDRQALQVGDGVAAFRREPHVDVVVLAVGCAPVADQRTGDEGAGEGGGGGGGGGGRRRRRREEEREEEEGGRRRRRRREGGREEGGREEEEEEEEEGGREGGREEGGRRREEEEEEEEGGGGGGGGREGGRGGGRARERTSSHLDGHVAYRTSTYMEQ